MHEKNHEYGAHGSRHGEISKLIVYFFNRKLATPPSSPIQTVLSALDFHQILPKKQARGLKEIAPSPPVGNCTLPRR